MEKFGNNEPNPDVDEKAPTYSSPYKNIHDTLQELDAILRNIGDKKALIGADLYAHSRVWGHKNEDQRGMQVEDFSWVINYFSSTKQIPPNFRAPWSQGMA
ncbi:hypothetical protein AVEN_225289-1 [Araneus ventricosus]|uniref:Endonuclease/exonuclease/phosphatase domain-containing protein n=1 Tax=Araneus ventricosus TaxID=182803 RepID=A0A4Y2AMW1_ARAVE|nr:hypothetical protein AVEN_225289-1 [Araneus ventricosus]